MKTHETLKKICDMIGYKIPYKCKGGWVIDYDLRKRDEYPIYDEFVQCDRVNIDEREIIFTPEFMEKFVKYYDNKTLLGPKKIYEQLGLTLLNGNLHDPTSYLANLLKIGTQKN